MQTQTETPVYNELDKSWKTTCKVLFGREVGELNLFQEWLASQNPRLAHAPSSLTGKDITYFITDYCEGSKRASLDEVWKLKKFPALSINEIKDVDSLVEAIQDRAYYTGDVVLGNSKFIEASSNCKDSYYVLGSGAISDSKYICNSARLKECEFAFGCDGVGESRFQARGYEGYRLMRCLEAWKSQTSSDCYYVNGVLDSSNCMFCFNVRNKRYAIGNLELPKEKYLSIKQGLVAEMAEQLEKKHSLPSLVEIVGKCKGHGYREILPELKKLEKAAKPDMAKIESIFGNTTEMLLGKRLGGIDGYSDWLRKHVLKMDVGKSIISGKPMLLADYSNYLLYPRNRLVTMLEAEYIGDHLRLDPAEAEKLSFASISEGISKIAYLSPEFFFGENINVTECSTQYQSMNAYRSPGASFTKNTAYSFWPRKGDCIFGSSMAFECFFCINCYYSENLNRCFEVDSSKSCSDSYYLHNCENVRSSMLCFNAKNLAYAVGNTVVGKEQFGRAKRMLLEWANEKLARKKEVPLSIFDVGCRQ
ncbi:MAG: hypothetical protein NTX79_05510 [Candidatus Micrarchaeota archaeon]|nr:hypothetical protein [Candidatus Micrarchaeota archaeon]